MRTPLRVETVTLEVNRAPYFVDLLREQLLQRYSVEELTANNLTIFTSLDLRLQAAAQRALEAGIGTRRSASRQSCRRTRSPGGADRHSTPDGFHPRPGRRS